MRLFADESETIVGTARELRRGSTTCAELVRRCLQRIDEWEPRIHAWVSVDRDGARSQAGLLDEELRAGRARGPLHGIPIGIKDIIDIAGLPTGVGRPRMAVVNAERDATVVRKLREAGAILLGKTVTTQLACFDPPPTRNPWNLAHTPGGSSSGSAAAVAAGMCLGAIGSQTGGSITRPAAFCGVAGCKPSYGRVSLLGIMPLAPSLDHPGPIARTVTDVAILLDAISGADPGDFNSGARHFDPIHLMETDAAAITAPRLARLRGFFERDADPEMRAAFNEALDLLASSRASIVAAPLPPSFDDVHRQHRCVMLYELTRGHGREVHEAPEEHLPGVRQLVDEGRKVTLADYETAQRHQRRTRAEIDVIFRDADFAICPAARGGAPELSTTGDPAFNSPWSFTGLPAVSFSIGLNRQGLPLAVQLVGRPFDEPRLFRAAAWCEAILQSKCGATSAGPGSSGPVSRA